MKPKVSKAAGCWWVEIGEHLEYFASWSGAMRYAKWAVDIETNATIAYLGA